MQFKLIEKEVKKFIIIFYIVGTAGFIIPFTNKLFGYLIPYALLLNFFLLAYFHKPVSAKKSAFAFLFIYLFSLIVEMLGVHSKIIFGDYTYGGGLGIKLFETPLLIGLNWVFLVYTTTAISNKLNIHSWLKVLVASFLMLAYDIVLEQVAPHLDMWWWKNNTVPIQNYLAWFGLAFIFNALLKLLKINIKNPLALIIFGCQFMFFVFLFVYFNLL